MSPQANPNAFPEREREREQVGVLQLIEMNAMAWLQASAYLVLSMLLARKVCRHVGGWIVHVVIMRPLVSKQEPNRHKLQVILAGFPRTGTASLSRALATLGLPCFHVWNLSKPSTAMLFMKAYKSGNPKYWEKLVDGYACIADFPATCGYKQLMEVFPNAKIILNIRDPNKWYNSFYQTIVRLTHAPNHAIFKIVLPWGAHCAKLSLYKQFFNGKPEEKEICIKAYLQHIDEVKEQAVAPHNLLVFDIEKDGEWSKLCEFLNVPIPNSPFPNANDRKGFSDHIDRVAKVYTMVFSLYVAFVSCTLVYLLL